MRSEQEAKELVEAAEKIGATKINGVRVSLLKELLEEIEHERDVAYEIQMGEDL